MSIQPTRRVHYGQSVDDLGSPRGVLRHAPHVPRLTFTDVGQGQGADRAPFSTALCPQVVLSHSVSGGRGRGARGGGRGEGGGGRGVEGLGTMQPRHHRLGISCSIVSWNN